MLGTPTAKDKRRIAIWLMIGAAMIFIQVVIGGITRLTGSGLSITRWEIITGTLPPLNPDQWQAAFDLYKQSPQYNIINEGMSLAQYKFIYFWEWFHRLWARLMGVVFLLPFCYFLFKRKFDKPLLKKAAVAFLLGATAGLFGWLMVASGLVDRPMVSPYRLAIHLGIAICTMVYLFWVGLELLFAKAPPIGNGGKLRRWINILLVLVCIQIFAGALVSGMRAAVFFPTWPDMNGYFIPPQLTDISNWSFSAFLHFDTHSFAPALMQFLHRMLAYFIVLAGIYWIIKMYSYLPSGSTRIWPFIFGALIAIQVFLGIFVLLNTNGQVPVITGVIHQGVALLILLSLIVVKYLLRPDVLKKQAA